MIENIGGVGTIKATDQGCILSPTEAEREEQDKIKRKFFAAAREGDTKLLKSLVGRH